MVLRALSDFAQENDAFHTPVVLTGDLNCVSFSRLRGIASAVALLEEDISYFD